MKTFFIDIETKPNEKLIAMFSGKLKAPGNYKDPDKIAAYIEEQKSDMVKKMSVDVDFCEVKCIGFKEDDRPAEIITLEQLIDKLEEHINIKLETEVEFVARHFYRIVTFNGRRFDLPVLMRECIRRDIANKNGRANSVVKEMKKWCRRFDNNVHVDLFEFIGEGEGKKLDDYSQIYLNWPKKEIDFATCSQEELEEHCKDDVEMTAQLYNKFKCLI